MSAKQGEAEAPGRRVVRTSRRDPLEWYGPADRRFLTETVRAHLRDWHGYDYDDWGDAADHGAG